MSWKTFAKWAIPIAAGAATIFTGGAAAPLLGMALGAGSGAATSALSGGGWKGALKGAAIGGALGGVGGGALKGMGGLGTAIKHGVQYGPAAMKAANALSGGGQIPAGMGGPQMAAAAPTETEPRSLGYLNPIGLQANRRTALAGMGTRAYV